MFKELLIANCLKNESTNNMILDKLNIHKNTYLLAVASNDKRKNILKLINAFEQISKRFPNIKLVLVGKQLKDSQQELSHNQNIIFTGYLSDRELKTLYSNALLHMYPSLYEGFGIPLIEAQYCGCPVLCSDIPVFREIGANSVEYCVPTVDGIANGLESLINNSKRLQELQKLGKENVERFSIEKIAKQVEEVLDV